MSDIFGPIVVGTDVERAVMDTLKLWMPTLLQEIELQQARTRGLIPLPRLYTTRNEFDSYPEDQLPMCVVVSPGLVGPPTKDGEGYYSATWAMAIGFAAQGKDADTSGYLAKVYGAAARWIVLNKGSLGGFASGVEWEDESYDDLVSEDARVVRACYNLYRVAVDGVVQKGVGPPTPTVPDPTTQPGSQWPDIELVDIDIVQKQ